MKMMRTKNHILKEWQYNVMGNKDKTNMKRFEIHKMMNFIIQKIEKVFMGWKLTNDPYICVFCSLGLFRAFPPKAGQNIPFEFLQFVTAKPSCH